MFFLNQFMFELKFVIDQERQQHVQSAERVLSVLDENYPDSFFLRYPQKYLLVFSYDIRWMI